MQSIKSKVFSLLAKRSYFSKELEKKLIERGYSKEEIKETIEYLKREGWLNDIELGKRFVDLHIKKGYGAPIIAHKLRNRAGEISISILA